MLKNAAHWITLAHLPRWNHQKINYLVKSIYADQKSDLEEFFSLQPTEWQDLYQLDENDILALSEARSQIPNNAFLAETLYNQGFELIPIIAPQYSPTLKENLKLTYSPPLLYVKGNQELLVEDSIAVVGSRNASDISLKFTDNIAKAATENYQVVVSGFAKGIDKAALDSSLKYIGHSIIVLPQGVLTFGSGYKTYYKQIIDGDVLVLSTFHPKLPWKVELAMARNPIIYGLARHIYVAESSDSGGTWSGVKDGLRKGREIFVRKPEPGENNANEQLISLGARPVDLQGVLLEVDETAFPPASSTTELEEKIRSLLAEKPLSAKDICALLELDWTARRMSDYLKGLQGIKTVKSGRLNKYVSQDAVDEQETIDL